VAVATSPNATSPPDTDAKNVLARPVDSAIVAERAPCSVKCSVVMNEIAAALGSLVASPDVAPIFVAITRFHHRGNRCLIHLPRIADDRIVEHRTSFDQLGSFGQLGALPGG
jgi:hypothetical protein